MTVVRAKFKVTAIEYYHYSPGSARVKLSAIHDTTTPENERFSKATPSGELSMMIDNPPAVQEFQLGKSYYLDFTLAPD